MGKSKLKKVIYLPPPPPLDPEIQQLNNEYSAETRRCELAFKQLHAEIRNHRTRIVSSQEIKEYHARIKRIAPNLRKVAKIGRALNDDWAMFFDHFAEKIEDVVKDALNSSTVLHQIAGAPGLMPLLVPLLLKEAIQKENFQSWLRAPHFEDLGPLADRLAATIAKAFEVNEPLSAEEREKLRFKIFTFITDNNRKSRHKAMSLVYQDALKRLIANNLYLDWMNKRGEQYQSFSTGKVTKKK